MSVIQLCLDGRAIESHHHRKFISRFNLIVTILYHVVMQKKSKKRIAIQ
jgi:hypothetical protein